MCKLKLNESLKKGRKGDRKYHNKLFHFILVLWTLRETLSEKGEKMKQKCLLCDSQKVS